MKERPILFSAPMVRAILEGRKTMTRRVVKPQPVKGGSFWELYGAGWSHEGPISCVYGHSLWNRCPYGHSEERLWCRETWQQNTMPTGWPYYYRATDNGVVSGPWTPSIFMPRAASRILLEITEVRVERLLAITDEDAIIEGVEQWPDGNWKAYGKHAGKYTHARDSFLSLWESIHGPKSWEQNPWVWVVSFKRNENL